MTRRIKHIVAIGLVALIASFAVPAPVAAQTQADYLTALLVDGRPTSVVITAVNTDTALLVRYVGAQVSGTVDVSANGDITFKHGAIGAEVVDTSVECDAAIAATGSRSGIWDVSIAACNTIAEGGGIINAQVTSTGVHNWIVIPLDAFGTDDLNWAGSGGLVTITGSSASTAAGLGLKWDTAVTFTNTIALLPPNEREMSFYTTGTLPTHIFIKPGNAAAPGNPFPYQKTILASANLTNTYGSGTSLYTVSEVLGNYNSTGTFSETVTTLLPSTAAAATTVLKTFVALSDSGPRIMTAEGQKMVLRVTNSADLSAITHNAYGITFNGNVASRR